jgi:hypothetical protein
MHYYDAHTFRMGPLWPWSYGSWIYNYLCNQCISPLMLWVQISIRARCTTIFVLHALIDLYFSFGKKLYCTFVDFKKAFDTVWRTGLWRKLQNCEIKGKCFKIIYYNMYNDIKSCVQYNGSQSNFFPCLTGVRQGENWFPFLFSIF